MGLCGFEVGLLCRGSFQAKHGCLSVTLSQNKATCGDGEFALQLGAFVALTEDPGFIPELLW